MKATIETLKDAFGNEVFRVSRIFPNSSSAHRGAISLDAINPDAFDPFAKGEAFDPPEFPPNCGGNKSAMNAQNVEANVTAGEYMAQLQADTAEGDLDPRATQAGIEGAGS